MAIETTSCDLSVQDLVLASGRSCTLSRPNVPGLKNYYVIALDAVVPVEDAVASVEDAVASVEDAEEFFLRAHRIARTLAQSHYGDPECYALMFSAGRTRRRPWPHVHIVVADSVSKRRRAVLVLQLKHVLWWRRWPSLVMRALGTQRCHVEQL